MSNVTAYVTCDAATQNAAHLSPCQKPFNYDKLLEELDGQPALIAKLLNIFIWETKLDIADLVAAIDNNNPNRVAIIAHRVKGGAAAIGAVAMKEEATRLEAMGRMGQAADARERLAQLQAEFERFRIYFAEISSLT
jgi:HPt (histidine-containing phosphotransfer) domain-containing protein